MSTYVIKDTSTSSNNYNDYKLYDYNIIKCGVNLKDLNNTNSNCFQDKKIGNFKNIDSCSGVMSMEEDIVKLRKNNEKLLKIRNLENNWNGYDAPGFDPLLIEKVRSIIYNIKMQPEIFPIAGGAIQLEYHKKNNEYFEVEVSLDDEISIFTMNNCGDEHEYNIPLDIYTLNEKIKDFYGR